MRGWCFSIYLINFPSALCFINFKQKITNMNSFIHGNGLQHLKDLTA